MWKIIAYDLYHSNKERCSGDYSHQEIIKGKRHIFRHSPLYFCIVYISILANFSIICL